MVAGAGLFEEESGADPNEERAVDGALGIAGTKENGCRGGRVALSADSAAAGKLLGASISLASVVLGAMCGRDREVEGGGLLEMPPGSAVQAMPGSGGERNFAGIQSEGAPKLFDVMSEQGPSSRNVAVVPLVAGEIWEKGPETCVRVGSSVTTTFSHTSVGGELAGTGGNGSGMAAQASHIADSTQRAGDLRAPVPALDAPPDGTGGPVLALATAVREGEFHVVSSQAGWTADSADSALFRRDAIAHSHDLGTSGADLGGGTGAREDSGKGADDLHQEVIT